MTAWAKSQAAIGQAHKPAQAILPTLRAARTGATVRHEMELPMTNGLPRICRVLAGAILLAALCGPVAFHSVRAAEASATGAPPGLELSAPGVAWAGFVAPKQP